MSELTNKAGIAYGFRHRLLSTTSALAFCAAVSAVGSAAAEDGDRPTVWIELGVQADRVMGQGAAFQPPFLVSNANSSFLAQAPTPLQAQNPPSLSFGGDGKISIQPDGSDWVFSASIAYGRSNNSTHIHHQTYKLLYLAYKYGVPQANQNPRAIDKFVDTHASRHESHAVLDFQAGKDVGLGMFGNSGSSVVSLGVRFAQFVSGTTFDVRGRPNVQIKTLSLPTFHFTLHRPYFHTYHASGDAARSFHGAGPSLSWDASAAVIGNSHGGEVTVDWGINAAVLFGRQRAHVQHHESAHYVMTNWASAGGYYLAYDNPSAGHNTSRIVTVPNVGGMVGATYRVENFKLSFGYRADFFFGAMDVGTDARKSETTGFYGPFAAISVGFGG